MNAEFLQSIESSEFDCFRCVYELSKHGSNIGLQFVLVRKLEAFSYTELEFFIPQLVQILVSFESDSMALHDMILSLGKKYPHFCLLAFWNLQAYVYELKSQPDSYSFHVVRSFINKLQDIMFNQRHEDNQADIFRENIQPAAVMSAAIAASFALPQIHQYCKPLIVSQGRQQKSFLFRLANFHQTLTKNLTLKNRGPKGVSEPWCSIDKDEHDNTAPAVGHARHSESLVAADSRLSQTFSSGFDSDVDEICYNSDYSQDRRPNKSKVLHPKKPVAHSTDIIVTEPPRMISIGEGIASHSMPDLSNVESRKASSRSKSFQMIETIKPSSISHAEINFAAGDYSNDRNEWALKANYFRKETEFMMVLQNISSRLSQVPKEARLTSLRAELSIINSALLPSQIDIPRLFPLSSSPQKRYHRILKLNVTEACVLNSAERVPFLLLIEYLSEDMDFDPSSDCNKSILSNAKTKDDMILQNTKESPEDSLAPDKAYDHEADLGDVSIVALSNQKLHFSNHLRANMTGDTSTGLAAHPRGVSLAQKYPIESDSSVINTSNGKTRDLSVQIRIAAVMLKQLEKSGQANSEQSAAIKSRIINSMEALQDRFETIDYQQIREISAVHDGASEPDAGERKIENDFKIGEDWAIKRARIRKLSPFGHLSNWDLCSVIVKNGDDLQQEAFACQLISVISNIWKNDAIGAWTKNMKIVVTSFNSGLVETINNALSVHSIKKTMTELSIKNGENPRGIVASIKDYFIKIHGAEGGAKYKKAQECFARSLAAYSVICYVLQIKDRHNGNIMLDNEGHIIHIDFGFILSNSPGSVGFEAAPFKLTSEYIEVLGGLQSPYFRTFVDLCKDCFLSLRKHYSQLVNLVDLMQKDSGLPCFKNGPQTAVLLKQRLQLDMSDRECNSFVETSLVGKSAGSVYTRLYDQFQLLTQGIFN